MKKLLPLFFGILSLTTTAYAEGGLYDIVLKQVRTGAFIEEEIDENLLEYLSQLFDEYELSVDEIKKFLTATEPLIFCGESQNENLSIAQECIKAHADIQRVAKREIRVRDMGRKLQMLTTGFELRISDLPGRETSLPEDIRGIVNIWMAGSGSVQLQQKQNTKIRNFIDEDTNRYESDLQSLKDRLEEMTQDEMIGAVWRYQFGVRLINSDRDTFFPPPYDYEWDSSTVSEQQYLYKRWNKDSDDVEAILYRLWEIINNTSFTTPVQQNEIVYFAFPEDLYGDMLPENVLLWARLDGNKADNQPFGDIGLNWRIPAEPVYPSLMFYDDSYTEPIPGGNYPLEPVDLQDPDKPIDGNGLCTQPVTLQGYLCRPFQIISEGERCPDKPAQQRDPRDIAIIQCMNPEDVKEAQGTSWCCNPQSRACSITQDITQCQQNGGLISTSANGCQANGCIAPQPVLCCMRSTSGLCTEATSDAECTQNGGSTVANEQACLAQGCIMPEPRERTTLSNADVCREINWREKGTFNPGRECKVDVKCQPSCTVQGGYDGFTKFKNLTTGTIDMCLKETVADLNVTYLLYHEMIHAYQYCNATDDTLTYKNIPQGISPEEEHTLRQDNTNFCCQMEGEAYDAMCNLMERDGVFDGAATINGIPINAQTCAESLTNNACSPNNGLYGCYVSYNYPTDFYRQVVRLSKAPTVDLADTCTDAIDKTTMDVRVKQLWNHIEKEHDVCEPGQTNLFENRIGNNACYIGQCVEQTTELHAVTPMQVPSVTQGQQYPWSDPLTSTPLGLSMTNYQTSQARLPLYQPALLIQEVERTLCRAQGLPPLTPPILCHLKAERQLGLKRLTGVDAIRGLIRQEQEGQDSLDEILQLSPLLGYRVGAKLYADYLRVSTRSFAGILTNAADLLEEIKDIEFPTEMCTIPDLQDQPSSSGNP